MTARTSPAAGGLFRRSNRLKPRSVVPSSADAALSAVAGRRQAGAQRRAIRRSLSLLSLGAAAGLAAALHGSPDASHAVVRRVIDGDTIELSDGRHVRYIGV